MEQLLALLMKEKLDYFENSVFILAMIGNKLDTILLDKFPMM